MWIGLRYTENAQECGPRRAAIQSPASETRPAFSVVLDLRCSHLILDAGYICSSPADSKTGSVLFWEAQAVPSGQL